MARRKRWELGRHFKRRGEAARKGIHLPSEDELLLGMHFFSGSVAKDLREYAARLAGKLRRKPRQGMSDLVAALDEAVVQPDAAAVRTIAGAVKAYEKELEDCGREDGRLDGCRMRCRIYLAHMGDAEACGLLAGEMADRARVDYAQPSAQKLTLVTRGLAWAALSLRIARHEEAVTGFHFPLNAVVDVDIAESNYQQLLIDALLDEEMTADERKEAARQAAAAAPLTAGSPPRGDDAPMSGEVVVIPDVGNANTKHGKEVIQEFKGFVGVPLQLPAVPDVHAVRKTLADEFPWAVAIVDEVLGDLRGRKHVRLRPTVLVGPPGGGKTRFAKALLTACEVRWDLLPCGGVNDSWLGGTPRRWHSGEPSMPIASVRRHGTAGPGLILDEVEKASVNRHNGALGDVLVGMLGRETGGRYYDPYIEAECDISHVTWLMTANAVEPLQAPLRDRCRILRFPEPGPEHLPVLAKRLLERHYTEAGHDPRWAIPFEAYELEALAAAWPGGSIRKLERLVDGVALARERQHGGN